MRCTSLTALLVAWFWAAWAAAQTSPAQRTAVLPVLDRGAVLDEASRLALGDALATKLGSGGSVQVASGSELAARWQQRGHCTDSACLAELTAESGAQFAVVTEIERQGETCRLRLSLIGASAAGPARIQPLVEQRGCTPEELAGGIDVLAVKLQAALEVLGSGSEPPPEAAPAPSEARADAAMEKTEPTPLPAPVEPAGEKPGQGARGKKPEEPLPRSLAVGVGTLKELGIAAGLVRARFWYLGVEGAFGILPILLMVSGDCNETIFKVSMHATGSLLVYFNEDTGDVVHGVRVGGVWDQRFGLGIIAGYQGEMSLTHYLSLGFGAGLQIYPNGDDWVVETLEDACGSSVQPNALLTYVQPYIGVNLLFYFL
ncbi:MAG: hypothetical protein JXR96_11470 [Deltaproteobacteria bacterium]|nr:hypothetical protein [Deltaproteobacteria bacterium]